MINFNKFNENIKKNIVKTIGISSFCNVFGMEENKTDTSNVIKIGINKLKIKNLKIYLENLDKLLDNIGILNKDFILKNNCKIKIGFNNKCLNINSKENLLEFYKKVKNFLNDKNNKNTENNKDLIFVNLYLDKDISNLSNLFCGCENLSSINNLEKLDTSKVTDMSSMFKNCSGLESLPDMTNWNINNVTDMSYMFYNCSSLTSLPDISKWNTKKVEKMDDIFSGCDKLKSSSNISK